MAIMIHIFYTGAPGNAQRFAREMLSGGTADAIRAEEGNLRYEYFTPLEEPDTVLLVDMWKDQAALDAHHASPMMKEIAALRDRYDLHMRVERFMTDSDAPASDASFIRK